jgi:Ser-tRNA(Ala) deacylase AlaX
MKLNRSTRKLYYEDFYLRQATATVVRIGEDHLELSATMAYPEGGGQESDHGVITCAGKDFRFIGAKKMYGELAGIPDFAGVQVGGVVWHIIHPDDRAALGAIEPGAVASIHIDVERRARLSLSHTASHLLFIGVGIHRPDATNSTLGCHIRIDSARFDFALQQRFSADEVAAIEATANKLVARDERVTVDAHETVPDARTWRCDQFSISCAGTHIDRTSPVGVLHIRRKGLGAGKERLVCMFPEATFEVDRYHDQARAFNQ